MCNPVAIFAVTAVLAVAGGVVQYNASKQAQKYNEQTAASNQKVAEAQAVDAERQGVAEANERRMRTRLQLGEQRVGFAAQNVDMTGTALDILGDTAMFGEIDENRIRANAARKAWGFRVQGWNIGEQSKLDSFQARVGRVGTVLTTVGKVASAYPTGGFGFGGGGSSMASSARVGSGTSATIMSGRSLAGYA